jgi:glutathione S-transferase
MCLMPNDNLPILYSFRRCPFAMRARLALAVSQTRCELREVVLRDKPAELLQASAKGTVPVLVLPATPAATGGQDSRSDEAAGQTIEHSLDIMLWALRRNDPERWLQPSADAFEDMLEWIRECDGPFKRHLDHYKYPERYPGSDPVAHRALAEPFLQRLDERLSKTPYLFGSHATLADRAIAPFVRQFAHTDKDWFAARPWSALQAWLTDFLDSALFERVMQKYPAWRPGSPAVWFPPERASNGTARFPQA